MIAPSVAITMSLPLAMTERPSTCTDPTAAVGAPACESTMPGMPASVAARLGTSGRGAWLGPGDTTMGSVVAAPGTFAPPASGVTIVMCTSGGSSDTAGSSGCCVPRLGKGGRVAGARDGGAHVQHPADKDCAEDSQAEQDRLRDLHRNILLAVDVRAYVPRPPGAANHAFVHFVMGPNDSRMRWRGVRLDGPSAAAQTPLTQARRAPRKRHTNGPQTNLLSRKRHANEREPAMRAISRSVEPSP